MKDNVKRSSKDETGKARMVRGHVGLRECKVPEMVKVSSGVKSESRKERSNERLR